MSLHKNQANSHGMPYECTCHLIQLSLTTSLVKRNDCAIWGIQRRRSPRFMLISHQEKWWRQISQSTDHDFLKTDVLIHYKHNIVAANSKCYPTVSPNRFSMGDISNHKTKWVGQTQKAKAWPQNEIGCARMKLDFPGLHLGVPLPKKKR